MRKTNKRGFTIVELVIVIAVIAILAAVLIPTFTNLVKKANVTADTQLVRNLNTALKLDNTKHETMYDALKAVNENGGFDVAKINASVAKNEILWDSVNDCFVYLNDGNITYIPNSKEKEVSANVAYWRITSEDKYLKGNDAKYSVYYTGTTTAIETTVGFDAGTTTGITSVNYSNTNSGQTVVIRTNSAKTELIVNASKDTVKHYDSVGTVHVIAVDPINCYEENGKAAFTQVDSGKYKTTATADVELLFVSSATNVKVAVTTGTVDHAHAISDTDANAINGTNPGVTFDYDGNTEQATIEDVYHHIEDEDKIGLSTDYATNKTKEEVQNVIEDAKSEEMADTVVWLNKAYNGIDKMSFVDFVDAVNSDENKFAGYIATLQANVTLEGETKLIEEFRGTFDGNNKTIKNISVNLPDKEYIGLFKNISAGATIKNVNISNANLTAKKKVGALIGKISGSATVFNCSVDSYSHITANEENAGGLIGYIQASTGDLIELIDLTNNAAVIAKSTSSSRAAGIAATVTGNFTANFRNCTNNGKIIAGTDSQTGDYVGGIVGSIQGGALVDFADCNAQISDLTGSKAGTMCPWITDNTNVSVSDTQMNDISKYFYTITTNYGSIEQGETIYFVSKATQAWPDLLANKQELSKQKLDTILDFLKWAEEKEYKQVSEYSNSGIIYVLKVFGSVSASWNKVHTDGPSYKVAEQEYCTEKGITYSAELFEKTWTTGILYEIK